MSSLRASVERASTPVLTSLARLPRPLAFLLVLAVMVVGLVVPGWGWVLLALVALFLCWLLLLFWPRLRPSERLMRLAVIVLVAAIALVRAFPR